MTPIDIKAARAVCEKATPGEWRQGSVEKYHVFVECRDAESLGQERVLLRANTHFPHEADMAFIAAARTGWPAALDEVEALRAEVARLGRLVDRYEQRDHDRERVLVALTGDDRE